MNQEISKEELELLKEAIDEEACECPDIYAPYYLASSKKGKCNNCKALELIAKKLEK